MVKHSKVLAHCGELAHSPHTAKKLSATTALKTALKSRKTTTHYNNKSNKYKVRF